MSRKITFPVLVVAILALVSACGISRVDDIKVTSWDVKYIAPSGLRSLDGVLLVGVDNPAMKFTIDDLQGSVKYNGRVLGSFSAEPVSISGKSSGVYEVPCHAVISDDVSLLEVMAIYSRGTLEGMKIDLSFKVRAKGVTRTMTYDDIDLNRKIKL